MKNNAIQTMSSAQLHELWQTIDKTPSSQIDRLNDADLVDWLMEQFGRDRSLPSHETNTIEQYLQSRLQLIRDVVLN